MGLEFRNNSYEENQNEVLSSSTEDRRWNAREDGAPCGCRVWERLWQAWGGRLPGRPLGRLLGPLQGHDQGKSYWRDREKVPTTGRRLSSGTSESPPPDRPKTQSTSTPSRSHRQAAPMAHPSAWPRLKLTPSPHFRNLFPTSSKLHIFLKRETNT